MTERGQRGGNRGSAREDKEKGGTRKGEEEMEVKNKIEETKEENGIIGTTLKTKQRRRITRWNTTIQVTTAQVTTALVDNCQTRRTLCSSLCN